MRIIIYYRNSKGKIEYIDRGRYRLLSGTSLFDSEWSYESKHNVPYGIQKPLTTRKATIVVRSASIEEHEDNLNELYELFDTDMYEKSQGRLYVGEYYINCYFVSNMKSKKIINSRLTEISFDVLSDFVWIKEETTSFIYSQVVHESGRGYPYGYAYDYSSDAGSDSKLVNPFFVPCNFKIIICGYAHNPYIAIGDNVYRLNATIQEGEYVTIDSVNKTIILTKSDGIEVNLFSSRDREYYIFEKIAAGESKVFWNGEFNFDVIVRIERSEPLWT